MALKIDKTELDSQMLISEIRKYMAFKKRYMEHLMICLKKPSLFSYSDIPDFSSNLPLVFREEEGKYIVEVVENDHKKVIIRQIIEIPKTINVNREFKHLNSKIQTKFTNERMYNILFRIRKLIGQPISSETEEKRRELEHTFDDFQSNYLDLIKKRDELMEIISSVKSETLDEIGHCKDELLYAMSNYNQMYLNLLKGLENEMDIRKAFLQYRTQLAEIISTVSNGPLIEYSTNGEIKEGILISQKPLIIAIDGEIRDIDLKEKIMMKEGLVEKLENLYYKMMNIEKREEGNGYLVIERFTDKKRVFSQTVGYLKPIEDKSKIVKKLGVMNRFTEMDKEIILEGLESKYDYPNRFICEWNSSGIVLPGKDTLEIGKDEYRELSQIKNWRRKLSNFSYIKDEKGNILPLVVNGELFPSVMHAIEYARIMNNTDVDGRLKNEIEKIGEKLKWKGVEEPEILVENLEDSLKEIPSKSGWNVEDEMRKVVWTKYSQYPEYGEILKKTRNALLCRVGKRIGNRYYLIAMKSVMDIRGLLIEGQDYEYTDKESDRVKAIEIQESIKIGEIEKQIRGMHKIEEVVDEEVIEEREQVIISDEVEESEEIKEEERKSEEIEYEEIGYHLYPLDTEEGLYYIVVDYKEGIYVPMGYWLDDSHKIRYFKDNERDNRNFDLIADILEDKGKTPEELRLGVIRFYVNSDSNKVYWKDFDDYQEVGTRAKNKRGISYVVFYS